MAEREELLSELEADFKRANDANAKLAATCRKAYSYILNLPTKSIEKKVI